MLSELLNPGGLLVLTLRFGQDAAENAAREFHAVSREELEQFARDRALICRHWIEAPDLRREDVRWETVVFQHPDDGSGGLSLLRHLIINDNKSATYKLGLLRALSHIAEAFPGAVIARDDASVTIPLGLVGLCWLKQYKPLIIHHRLAQLPQAQQPGFAKDAFFALAGFADPDLRVGSMLSAERADVLTAALSDACRLIQKMPAHYTTWPGTHEQIFETEYCSPGRVSAGSPGSRRGALPLPRGGASGSRRHAGSVVSGQGTLRINPEYLARFGTMRVPAPIWQSLGQYACWLEPVIVNEWLGLMRNWSRGVGEVDLIQPELFKWEEVLRFTGDVRQRLDALRQSGINVPCTWTGRRVRELDIDHAFPWSRWPNNDLWNLLPTAATVNRSKSDRLPTVAAFEQARPQLLDWWGQAYLAAPLKERFLDEVTLALPCLDAGIAHAPETIYTAMLAQRARIKRDQQLPDWPPKGATRSL